MTDGLFDPPTRALIALAAAIAQGDDAVLQLAVDNAVRSGTPPLEVDELVLQSVLTVGWPRALVAAAAWRSAIDAPAEVGEVTDYAEHGTWTGRGEATCRLIYGDHYQKLRANVRGLHPALDAWMVTEGYGRTLSRPGLAARLRELSTVAQTAVLRTPRQLHSHLLGALHAGATAAEVDATLDIVRPLMTPAGWEVASALWQRTRPGAVRS